MITKQVRERLIVVSLFFHRQSVPMGQGVIALGFKDKHTPSPLRGTPPASGGERRTGGDCFRREKEGCNIDSGRRKRMPIPVLGAKRMAHGCTPTMKSRNRLPIAGLPYFITFADTYPCIIASISSGVTRFCSPLTMFFSITLPSAISVSPTMATYGICFTLAYCICFFILALSG